MKIAVIGAGAWGTALAISASRHAAGHRVQLWTRDAAAAKAMQSQRSNQRYLPDVNFPDALQCAS
ncbi:MAG: 2-dehydropantoate 2-reductase N-terminal domain-containing protein, partial [Burkholderiales bacterium]